MGWRSQYWRLSCYDALVQPPEITSKSTSEFVGCEKTACLKSEPEADLSPLTNQRSVLAPQLSEYEERARVKSRRRDAQDDVHFSCKSAEMRT